MGGIDSVKESYEKLFKESRLSLKTNIVTSTVTNDDAVVTGYNTGKKIGLADSSETLINDFYIACLFRNSKGEWKINLLNWGANKK